MNEQGLEWFNELPAQEAENQLFACLASRRWAAEVVAMRPYRDVDNLLGTADITSGRLTDEEMAEAITAHPRIGDGGGDAPASSEREQSRVMQASPQTLEALATDNRRYEERFGHVFLIAASGRSGEEILSELRRRMRNDPARELSEATVELQKIARLRVEKLLLR